MADLHDLASYRGDRGRLSASIVAQALAALGGAAHRDLIVDLLMASLRQPLAKAALAAEVDRVLRENAGDAKLFTQPFGADSRRWVLQRPAPAMVKRAPAPRAAMPVLTLPDLPAGQAVVAD